ncbi:DUF3098 domain-containing protein [Segetibacter aerophilus]|uniref:DUF3098 domain-containing protein n=1 Tax=Segetibacter aerophilus TaxID=670293 RepID=A0A512BID0_9BACT|nr:DUF3098 domain-containing protein [Segetibacter aerophilus]GEO11739.1 hypothetical protein SAE01_42350 [Segetibacter aerophilus]
MAEKKIYTSQSAPVRDTVGKQSAKLPLFEKDNYQWMIIGAVVVAIGMFVMSGGKNSDPNQFDPKLVYSTTRITIAPILILAGLIIEIYAIFKRPKAHQ